MCKLGSFMYLYTVQVGVAVYSAWGLGLMTISVIVNVSSILTSISYADYLDDSTMTETCVHLTVFVIFISLGYVAYGAGLAGAYQERLKPMFAATVVLCVHGFMWLSLTALSSYNHPVITGFFCVDHMRCADRFFISDANWRVSPTEPDHFWNFFPNYAPSKIFRTNAGCWEYCNRMNAPSPSPTAGLLTDDTTTESNSGDGSRGWTTTPRSKRNKEKLAAPEPPTTTTTSTPTPIPPTTLPTITPTTTIIAPTEPETAEEVTSEPVTIEETTPEPEETTTTVSTTTRIPCICYKTLVQTLVGPLGAPIHKWISITYSVLITVFWYAYSICIFISYINYLREEEELET